MTDDKAASGAVDIQAFHPKVQRALAAKPSEDRERWLTRWAEADSEGRYDMESSLVAAHTGAW